MMKRLWGKFWWANRAEFLCPGLYFCTTRTNRRILALPRRIEPPKLVTFPEVNVTYAENQPEYRPLPCHRFRGDPTGRIVFCWKLSLAHRLKVVLTGRLWHEVMTFGQPLQPQLLLTDKPEIPKP